MRIKLIKGSAGQPDQMCCTRTDGSQMQAKLSERSAYHDLAHFVVESRLQIKGGFFGMIASGAEITDFAMENADRHFQISPDGYKAEFLSSLVQAAVPVGHFAPAYTEMLQKAAQTSGIPFPEIPGPSTMARLLTETTALTRKWETLAEGQAMELEFPEPSARG